MNMKYNAGTGELKNWLVQEEVFDERCLGKCESIFAQGNGYLGIRHALEESYLGETRNTFVTGTFDKAAEEEVTELPNAADMTGCKIIIDGNELNLAQGNLHAYTRTLNLKNGEVVRKITWENPKGVVLDATFKRFVSLKDEHLMVHSIDLTFDQEVSLQVETGIDGSVTNGGAQHFRNLNCRLYNGKEMEYLAQTRESKIWFAHHAVVNVNVETSSIPVMRGRSLKVLHRLQPKAGETIHIEKISLIRTSRDMKYEGAAEDQIVDLLKQDGQEALRKIEQNTYEELKQESEKEWKAYWDSSDIKIQGDDFDQLAIRFALYHLRIMAKADDGRVGVGAKALTGEGYSGHSFWDTEMFILPYYIMTHPKTARALLEYRYKNLDGAREKAKDMGYEGALYPWECAWIDDGEVTPRFGGADVVTGQPIEYLTGVIEHHISADVAYGVNQYYQITGDQDYMDRYGYEIILDTALFWSSRVEYNKEFDRNDILDVIGPDEYKEHVDNNAYTNYMAAYNMELALKIMDELPKQNMELYQKLDQKLNLNHIRERVTSCLEKLYLPKPDENGIVEQFQGYKDLKYVDLKKYKESDEVMTIYKDYGIEEMNELMVSKQADFVMLMFALDTLFDEETRKKNFIYYEERTIHDSSLSKCTHAILANDLDMQDMAYDMYESAIRIDLGPYMKSSKDGIHSASIGGIWQGTVMGFGGVRMEGDLLRIAPKLPKQWDTLEFPLMLQGNPIWISASHEEVVVENKGSHAVTLILVDETVEIAEGEKKKKTL